MTKRESLKATAAAWNYAVDVDGAGEDADTYSRGGYTVTVWWSADGTRAVRVYANATRVWGGYAAAFYLLAHQPHVAGAS
jgi:hypothetical protein